MGAHRTNSPLMGIGSLAATVVEFLVAPAGFPPSTMLVERASATEEVVALELVREVAKERSDLLAEVSVAEVSVPELSWTSTCIER